MLELIFDPILDVPRPVAEIPPHSKTRRPFSPISPLVEGGYRHSEIVGKFFHGEQLIAGFHGLILQSHPFTRMSNGCRLTCQQPRQQPSNAGNGWW